MFWKKKKVSVDYCEYTNSGGRRENEDSCKVVLNKQGTYCCLVADGLGGHGGGERASKVAVESVAQDFLSGELQRPEEFFVWFQQANQKVFAMQTAECAMKTTLVALQMNENNAIWAHIGDSRLYYFAEGKLVEKTCDHSVSQMAVFRGEITEQEIRGHVDRNRLLRALGRDEEIKIDVSEILEWKKGNQAFLLCTDGFWEYVLEEEMEAGLRQSDNAEEWIAYMVRCLNSRAKEENDNNTAIGVIVKKK